MNKNETGEELLKRLGFYQLSKLTEEEKKPPEFIVDGLIPVGLTFLSGAPKIRKSFLALQLSAAVATGNDFLGFKTTRCGVCYFDLEGSKSRVSDRAEKMSIKIPDSVYFVNRTDAKISKDFHNLIKAIHETNPDIRLFIIDTFSRARGIVSTGGQNAYDVDVRLLEPIQQMAMDQNISALFVHHNKKRADLTSDTLEMLSGTMGISGSADSIINLTSKGQRFEGQAKFEYNPRDAKGGEFDILFSDSTLEWQRDTNEHSVSNNPVARFIINHAPERGREGVFFRYEDVFRFAFNGMVDNCGSHIKREVETIQDELFDEYRIAVQTSVRSNSARGIRIISV